MGSLAPWRPLQKQAFSLPVDCARLQSRVGFAGNRRQLERLIALLGGTVVRKPSEHAVELRNDNQSNLPGWSVSQLEEVVRPPVEYVHQWLRDQKSYQKFFDAYKFFGGVPLHPRMNCTGVKLSEIFLGIVSDDSANEIDFSGAQLYRVHFCHKIQEYNNVEKVSRVKWQGASFRDTSLDGCTFSGMHLIDPDFSSATMRYPSFLGSLLENARFHDAALDEAWFENTEFVPSPPGDDAVLSSCVLSRTWSLFPSAYCGQDLSQLRLWRNFANTDLSNCKISQTDPNITFQGANLCNADLRGANLVVADLRDAKLHGALLEGAALDYASVTAEQLASALGACRKSVPKLAKDLVLIETFPSVKSALQTINKIHEVSHGYEKVCFEIPEAMIVLELAPYHGHYFVEISLKNGTTYRFERETARSFHAIAQEFCCWFPNAFPLPVDVSKLGRSVSDRLKRAYSVVFTAMFPEKDTAAQPVGS